MKKAWKTILIIALCILIVGEIVLGVGLATGGLRRLASGSFHLREFGRSLLGFGLRDLQRRSVDRKAKGGDVSGHSAVRSIDPSPQRRGIDCQVRG